MPRRKDGRERESERGERRLGIINQLDIQVANLIAAGEVADRPASCAKELLENALDAGATEITIEIKRGGIAFLRVTDNGCGMAKEDLPISIKRHATSKIRVAADLDGIQTLGFRGEALAAIASVSRLRIMTKRKEDRFGSLLTAEFGKMTDLLEVGSKNGTTVIVENLFANVPARRKFLKRDASEALAVSGIVEKLAISRPDIAFKFLIDGNLKFATPGDNRLITAVYSALGRDYAEKLIKVRGETEGIEVLGYVSRPESVRANRTGQNFFINGRYVRSKTATAALEQAFDSYCESGKFPYCVLFISVHPTFVDVNVHPTKLEVKFSNERAVFDAVYCAVRNTLTDKAEKGEPLLEPRRVTPSERGLYNAFVPLEDRLENTPTAPLTPEKAFDEPSIGDLLPPDTGFGRASPRAPGGPFPGPFAPDGGRGPSAFTKNPAEAVQNRPSGGEDTLNSLPQKTAGEEPTQTSEEFIAALSKLTAPVLPDEEVLPNAPSGPEPNALGSPAVQLSRPATEKLFPPLKKDGDASLSSGAEEAAGTVSPKAAEPTGMADIAEGAAPPAAHAAAEKAAGPEADLNAGRTDAGHADALPPYRIIGEAFHAYIIVELSDTTLILDKHAAHERILFEKMKKNRAASREKAATQLLLIPLTLSFSAEERAALAEYEEELHRNGFDFTLTETGAILTGAPAGFTADETADMLAVMAGQLAEGTGSVALSRSIFYEKALYQASCKAAMKAGLIDTPENIRWLVEEVLSQPDIRYCPHGRPIAFELSRKDMEKFFKRT